MDKDIAPGLIENVNKAFEANCMKDGNMQAMAKKLESGAASYEDAYKYAVSVGNARAKAFKSEISSDVLPDGRMYYNIADRLMNDSLGTDHDMVADYAAKVQEIYNEKEGIGIKALKADKDESRIKGFVDRLDSEENFDNVSWILDEPVKVHAMSVVDDTIRKNAEFHSKAGIKATVIRDAKADCCPWCTDLAGDYTYPRVPGEVFARHDNCRCTLEYNGRRLSAYESGGKSHSFRDQGEQEKIEARITLNNNKTVDETNRSDILKSGSELTKATREFLAQYNVTNNPVRKLDSELSEEDIIFKLHGQDTSGHCTSLAMAYIGNKNGLDVKDFRGGASEDIFSRTKCVQEITKLANGVIEKDYNDYSAVGRLLKSVEKDREYFLSTGHHTAIIRKAERGFEYLQLQSNIDYGWKKLDNKVLGNRFKCAKTHSSYGIKMEASSMFFDIESVKGNKEFELLLGYINNP